MLAKVGLVNYEGLYSRNVAGWNGLQESHSMYNKYILPVLSALGFLLLLSTCLCFSLCTFLQHMQRPVYRSCGIPDISNQSWAYNMTFATLAQNNGPVVRSSLTGTMAGQDEPVRNPWVGAVVMANQIDDIKTGHKFKRRPTRQEWSK